jgi:hypothetical protein
MKQLSTESAEILSTQYLVLPMKRVSRVVRNSNMNKPITSLLLSIILPLSANSGSNETRSGINQQTEPTQLAPSPASAPATTTTPGTNSTEQARILKAWRISMAHIPLPKKGCFEASYPSKEWREVPSANVPQHPMRPRRGPRPSIVGNGNNVSAQAPAGPISSATGSFDSVTGVTSESGQIGSTGPAVANAYTLQLNMNFFPSTVGGPAGCQGWEQFVFENDGGNTPGFVYIQYWLINYGTISPGPGWNQFGSSWWKNSSNASATPSQPIGNLANLSLGGTVTASGDSYFFSTGSSMYAATGDNLVNAAAGWNAAEFGVFGDTGGSTANFNSGSAIVTRTEIVYRGTAPPTCVADGWTGEMNNLNFGPTAPGASPPPPGPALLLAESTAGEATATCAAATSVGESFWVDFNTGQNPPAGTGTYDNPVLTLTEGVNGVPTGGDVWIRTAGSSAETLTISKAMTIHAYNGPATVGQ